MPTPSQSSNKEAAWSGKSRGGTTGYRIFVFILKNFGLRPAYFILLFVAFYFLIFSPKSTKASYRFFRLRLGKGWLGAVWGVYRTYYAFGQTLLDKTAVLSGLDNKFTFDFDGENNLHTLRDEKKGALLIGGHLGNWEIAGNFLRRNGIGTNANIYVVMLDAEHQRIKQLLASQQTEAPMSIIAVKDDMSHVFQISQVISNNGIICIHGDRFLPNSKTLVTDFMGQPAHFPLGVFQMAARLKIPCTFVFAMKESATHYHFYSTPPIVYNRDVNIALQDFSEILEKMVRRYPYQWYNFYDFWAEPVGTKNDSKNNV